MWYLYLCVTLWLLSFIGGTVFVMFTMFRSNQFLEEWLPKLTPELRKFAEELVKNSHWYRELQQEVDGQRYQKDYYIHQFNELGEKHEQLINDSNQRAADAYAQGRQSVDGLCVNCGAPKNLTMEEAVEAYHNAMMKEDNSDNPAWCSEHNVDCRKCGCVEPDFDGTPICPEHKVHTTWCGCQLEDPAWDHDGDDQYLAAQAEHESCAAYEGVDGSGYYEPPQSQSQEEWNEDPWVEDYKEIIEEQKWEQKEEDAQFFTHFCRVPVVGRFIF